MNFSTFDKTEIKKYADEAKQKWGCTDAYKEYIQKHYDSADKTDKLMQIFAEIGKIKHLSPYCEEAQNLIKKLQNFITENYYTCTDELLRGLGQMYKTNASKRALTMQEVQAQPNSPQKQ